jgi:hypothetical protein
MLGSRNAAGSVSVLIVVIPPSFPRPEKPFPPRRSKDQTGCGVLVFALAVSRPAEHTDMILEHDRATPFGHSLGEWRSALSGHSLS